MVFWLFPFQGITALAIAGGDLMNKTQSMKKFESPVDRRQADPRIHRIQGPINILGRQMAPAPAQKGQDDLAGRRPAAGILPETVLPLVSSGHSLTS